MLAVAPVESDPCNPSPCGPNAQCNAGLCACLPEYQGDPYTSCRPECVLNNDCPRNRACVRNKCVDPCPGTCGRNAICNVLNHVPMCSCPTGMAGNAFISCDTLRGTKNDRRTECYLAEGSCFANCVINLSFRTHPGEPL